MNGRTQDNMMHALGLYTSFFPFYMDFSYIVFFGDYLDKVRLYMHDTYQYGEFRLICCLRTRILIQNRHKQTIYLLSIFKCTKNYFVRFI